MKLKEAFDNYGPIPGICFRIAADPRQAETQDRVIAQALRRLQGPRALLDPQFTDFEPHDHIFLLYPIAQRQPGSSIISRHVVRLITEELDLRGGSRFWKKYDWYPFQHPMVPPKSQKGSIIWGMHAMRRFEEGMMRGTTLFRVPLGKNASDSARTDSISLPIEKQVMFRDQDVLMQQLSVIEFGGPMLFQQHDPSGTLFGGLIVSRSTDGSLVVTFLEPTLSTDVDDVTLMRLNSLVQNIKDAGLAHIFLAPECRWRIVFVAPERELAEWTKYVGLAGKVNLGRFEEYVMSPD